MVCVTRLHYLHSLSSVTLLLLAVTITQRTFVEVLTLSDLYGASTLNIPRRLTRSSRLSFLPLSITKRASHEHLGLDNNKSTLYVGHSLCRCVTDSLYTSQVVACCWP